VQLVQFCDSTLSFSFSSLSKGGASVITDGRKLEVSEADIEDL